MGFIVGLDIGGTTTKIIGYEDGNLFGFVQVKASDPFTSASGGLGKFLNVVGKDLHHVEQIYATGVGASQLNGDIFGCKTRIVPEFDCVGLGGLYLAGLDQAIVVSMGTGTAFIRASALEGTVSLETAIPDDAANLLTGPLVEVRRA